MFMNRYVILQDNSRYRLSIQTFFPGRETLVLAVALLFY